MSSVLTTDDHVTWNVNLALCIEFVLLCKKNTGLSSWFPSLYMSSQFNKIQIQGLGEKKIKFKFPYPDFKRIELNSNFFPT